MNVQTAAYGSWKSPVTAEVFTARSVIISQMRIDSGCVFWIEGQPKRAGRNVLLSRDQFGHVREVLPLIEGQRLVHVATRVHEYGGRAYAVKNNVIVLSDGTDNRVYLFDYNQPTSSLKPLTPLHDCRYGDFEIDPSRGFVYAICEDHRGTLEPVNKLVAIPLDGSAARNELAITTVYAESDFVASPTLSPDTSKLAWITWNHPQMPWTQSKLHVAALHDDGTLNDSIVLVDRSNVAVCEPRWTLDGDLIHIDDSTGWANLYRTEGFSRRPTEPMDAWSRRLRTRSLHPSAHAFSKPQWQLGLHSYDNFDHNHLVCSWSENGQQHLGTVRLDNGLLEEWNIGWFPCGNVAAANECVFFLGDSPDSSPCIIRIDHGNVDVLRSSTDTRIELEMVSRPQAISWPTRDGDSAFGFFYSPTNAHYRGDSTELPPLIVSAHAGPTDAFRQGLKTDTQFWTTRGFAVLEVNYRGSTGYGRGYRSALNGHWGVTDALDCADGALWAANSGLVDPKRIAIRGYLAGGFTALNALIRTDVFSAGTSICGIADLETFRQSTHKFERHYAEMLLDTTDSNSSLWKERSPLTNLAQIEAPLLLLGGTNDPVIPGEQAKLAFQALQKMNKPVALELFPDEGHSFARAETIHRAWNAELAFYGQVWGIEVIPQVPLTISNFG